MILGAAIVAVIAAGVTTVVFLSNRSTSNEAAADAKASATEQAASSSSDPAHVPAEYVANAQLLCDALWAADPSEAAEYPLIKEYENTDVPDKAPPDTYADCWILTKNFVFDTSPAGGSINEFEYVQLKAQIGGDHDGMSAAGLLADHKTEQGAICEGGGESRTGKFDGKQWAEYQCLNQIGENEMVRVIPSDGVEFVVKVMRAQSSGHFTLDDFDPIADKVLAQVI